MSSGGPQVAEQSHAKEQFKRLKRLKRRAKSLWERICGKAVSPPAAQPSPQQLDGAPLEQLPTIEPDSVQRRASLIGVVPRRPTSPTGTLPRNTYEAEGSVKGCPSQDLLPVANDEEMDNLGTSGKSFARDTAEKRNDESNGQERASSIEIQPKAAAKPLSIGDLEHQDNHANQAPTQDDAETSSLSTRARSYSSTTNVIGVVDTGLTIKPETDVWTLADQSSWLNSLADTLKISTKADHMYYDADEPGLRLSFCIPGTRVQSLTAITQWAADNSTGSESVFWLSGLAGVGKTTIAYTVSHQLESIATTPSGGAVLGGTFFCSRLYGETRTASAIIRTLVYQLALKCKLFQIALKRYAKLECVNDGPKSQLEGLLVVPWQQSAQGRLAENAPCYILSIDALDELDGESGSEFFGALLDTVTEHELSGLKFLVTSKAEPDSSQRIESFQNKRICRLYEVPIAESDADIRLYLAAELGECASLQQIEQLFLNAAGLFIYAATVVEYVKGRDLEEQRSLVKRILASSHPTAISTLDDLYCHILETSLVDRRDRDDPEMFMDCLSILHTFLCTTERTSPSLAVSLLNSSEVGDGMALDTGMANGILHRLYSVLYLQGGRVMWFHQSFPDLIFDEQRSGRFYCNQEQQHRRLANGCLGTMRYQLRFNIANIQDSYQLDRDNPALTQSIKANISPDLKYACTSWSAHLSLVAFEEGKLVSLISNFVELQILFWIETMNLLGERWRCERILNDVRKWVCTSEDRDLSGLANNLADAAAFVSYFGKHEAALSTPHLYISSLATWPCTSTLSQTWREHFGGIPLFTPSSRKRSSTELSPSPTVVTSVSYSSSSMCIVSALDEGSIQVWDTTTGEIRKTLKGHSDTVCSVACSPDGLCVASGSVDHSVRLWDLSTEKEPLVLWGHQGTVKSVAYSPDNAHVVSGSCDNTVRVWDVSTGTELRILRGHTGAVTSVAFSPDSTCAVSGSRDRSVKIWDIYSGKEQMCFNGDAGEVLSVVYSADGTCIVSGWSDALIRVWRISTGTEVKIQGHTGPVTSVAFAANGTHLVSGSEDQSIRLWDLSAGTVLPLIGHAQTVTSVAFSSAPDGVGVVSGSLDGTARLWLPFEDSIRYIREQKQGGRYSGWLRTPTAFPAFLMFVPLSENLPDDSNILTFPPALTSHIDFSSAKLGESWTQCYTLVFHK